MRTLTSTAMKIMRVELSTSTSVAISQAGWRGRTAADDETPGARVNSRTHMHASHDNMHVTASHSSSVTRLMMSDDSVVV